MTTESGAVGRAVGRQMRQYMKNILRIGADTFSQLFCGSGFTNCLEKFGQMALQFQQPVSRLFSSLHPGLIVRIHVSQRSVKGDSALIQGDQSFNIAEVEGMLEEAVYFRGAVCRHSDSRTS